MTKDDHASVEAQDLLQAWRAALGLGEDADDTGFAVDVARVVLDAVIASARKLPVDLHDAGRRWAASTHSAAQAIDALQRLRGVLSVIGGYDPEAVSAAIDTVVVVVAARADAIAVEAEKLSLVDPLTGIGNRRAFDQGFRHLAAGARRSGHDVTVLMVDITGLKQINDTHGHLAGDRALVALAGAFSASMRASDAIYRIGGDEFVVLLPGAAPRDVAGLVDRVRSVGAPGFDYGAATLLEHGGDITATLAGADAALYRTSEAPR